MIRLIRFLITGDWHLHKWVTIKEVPVFEADDDKLPSNLDYHLRCEHCGKIKRALA